MLLPRYEKSPAVNGRAGNKTELPGYIINTDSVVFYYNRLFDKFQEKMMQAHDFSARDHFGYVGQLCVKAKILLCDGKSIV